MKKGLIIGVVALGMALCLTGCVSKNTKLVCTQTSSGVDVTFNVDFKGNLLTAMNFAYDMDLSSYSDLQIESIGKQDFCEIVKPSLGTYKDGFENCQQSITNKKLNVNAHLNVDKMSDSVLDRMGTPKATKEELEKQGYTCTTK